jgi:hypothetical protein
MHRPAQRRSKLDSLEILYAGRFKAATDANVVHIPYRSGGALMPDLIGGRQLSHNRWDLLLEPGRRQREDNVAQGNDRADRWTLARVLEDHHAGLFKI